MAANEQRSLPLSCRTHPLCLALRRPRIADGFGGQDQAPPDCGSVTPERVEPVLGTPYTSPCKFRGLHAYLRGGTSSSPSDGAAGRDEASLKGPGMTPCRLRLGSATPLHVRSAFPSCSLSPGPESA